MIKILDYDRDPIMINEDHIIKIYTAENGWYETYCVIEMSDGRKIRSRNTMEAIQKRIEEHKARYYKPKEEKTTKYLVTREQIMT